MFELILYDVDSDTEYKVIEVGMLSEIIKKYQNNTSLRLKVIRKIDGDNN
jgi:hypothetical protein